MTTDEIENIINHIREALMRAKEARRVSKKVHGDDKEVSFQLRYSYQSLKLAEKALEDR